MGGGTAPQSESVSSVSLLCRSRNFDIMCILLRECDTSVLEACYVVITIVSVYLHASTPCVMTCRIQQQALIFAQIASSRHLSYIITKDVFPVLIPFLWRLWNSSSSLSPQLRRPSTYALDILGRDEPWPCGMQTGYEDGRTGPIPEVMPALPSLPNAWP